jgi:hypothetical protein
MCEPWLGGWLRYREIAPSRTFCEQASNTTTFINLDIHLCTKQPITSPLAHPPTYTSPRAPPTSSCNNHSQIPSSHLQVYIPRNAALGPGRLHHDHSQQLSTISLRRIRTSLFSAALLLASENFPTPVLAFNGRVDVAFHAPAACMAS